MHVGCHSTNSQYLNQDNPKELESVYNVLFDDVDQEQQNERVEKESDTDAEDVPPESREGIIPILKEAALKMNPLSENIYIIYGRINAENGEISRIEY
mgnify:CR=1 FL=1